MKFMQSRNVLSDRTTFALPIFICSFLFFTKISACANSIDWPTLNFTQAVTITFVKPTGITHAGDGSQRLFITSQPGQIWIVQNDAALSQPFLDISNRVLTTGAEQGLLGLAFPPGFSTNNHFYVDYTRKPDGAIVISRFFVTATNSNVADANSEQIIKVISKPNPSTTYNNHNAGQLAFGPDGYLYIGVGDGGSEGDPLNNGQNTNLFFGKILRIDVESGASPYAIPPSNPFVNGNGCPPETWAWGLRNPWRFSFDRQTGDLYIGDVGQNMYEEIDFQPAGSLGGQNYGWRIMEGTNTYKVPTGFTNFPTLTPPVAVYSHTSLPADGAGSVTGGYVYRGPNAPRLNGMYLYGDFMAGWIWGMKRDGTNWQSQLLFNPIPPSPHFMISTFGEDDLGQLYLADYYTGKIYRIQDSGQVWTPTFSPTGGTIFSNTVTVTCFTTNAEIHYTTNGIDPTLSDPIVISGGTIQVTTGITNKLRAFRADLSPSDVAVAIYTNKVVAPVFSLPSGTVAYGTLITISTMTPGATIYYTTDGTTPTINSQIYSGPLTIQTNVTLKAIGIEDGYNNSSITTGTYSLVQVATPIFTSGIGQFISGLAVITNGTSVSISCSTANSIIYYTLDGSAPTTNSLIYSKPIIFYDTNGPITLKAIASATGDLNSLPQSVSYGFIHYENTVVTTFAGQPTGGWSDAAGQLAMFYNPQDICIDKSGNFYVADNVNDVIREISPTGLVTTFAVGNSNDLFQNLTGVCVDDFGNVFVADNDRVCKIISNENFSVLSSGYYARQLVADSSGNLYVGSTASVQKVFTNGVSVKFAGSGTNGVGGWSGTVGLGIDWATNVYAATEYKVWKITPDGVADLYAGSVYGYSDGPRILSLFLGPLDAAVDSATNVYVSDQNFIRKISPAGWVSTLAGAGVSGYRNGPGYEAQFDGADGLCVDTNGNIYVADSGNNCIRKISPDTADIGIADDWQIAHFGHIGIDPNADPDHDGLSNYQEFWAGTDPNDPNSVLAIDHSSLINGGQIQIRWQTVAGKTYAVQYSSDLASWNNLGNPIQGDGSIATVNDTLTTQQRYYRIALVGF